MLRFAIAVGFVMSSSIAVAQVCGPVVLAGHDADDHGFEAIYARVFDELAANVQNGQQGILAIGADPGSVAGLWIDNIANLMVIPQVVSFVNNGAIATIDFSSYAILHVPSDEMDTDGGINGTEAVLLNQRVADVTSFIAGGGGLFGLAQGELPDGFSYVTGVAPLEYRHAPPSGALPSGDLFEDISATAEGLQLGITNGNLDGCCFHNVFTVYPPFLRPLAVANAPNDADFHQEAVFIGGVSTCIEDVVLAVEFDRVSVEQTAAGAVIRWSTLSEEGTTGFVVYRKDTETSVAGVEVSAHIAAHGPGEEYRTVDAAPPTGTSWYYVQEFTVDGVGDRSESMPLVVAPRGDGGRDRGGARR